MERKMYIYIINFCCNLLSPSIIIVLSFRYLHKRRDVTHVLIGCRLERKLANRNDWIRCSTPQMEVEFVTYELLWKINSNYFKRLKLFLRSERYPIRLGCNFVLQWRLFFVFQFVPFGLWSDLVLYLFRIRMIARYFVLNGDLILYGDACAGWSRTGKRTDSSRDSVPGIVRIFFYVFVNLITPCIPFTSMNFYKISYVEDLHFV